MQFLAWIENTGLSVWFREAIWAFPTLLVLHAIGMAFLVGISLIFNLRIIGFSKNLNLVFLSAFYPLLILAFIVSLVSGLSLLWAYPAKGLTNPLFYCKILLVLAAFVLTLRQKSLLIGAGTITQQAKYMAFAILSFWVIGIVSGRLLAYTHTWLLVS